MKYSHQALTKHYYNGFTLIEVMIVVVMLGIIAAIALPAYQRYVLQTHRKAAIADMLNLQQQLERQYMFNNGAYQYLNGATAANDNMGSCVQISDYTSGSPPRYRMAINITNNNQAYTITAAACPATGQDNDSCGDLRLTSDDLRLVNKNGGSWTDGGSIDHQCF